MTRDDATIDLGDAEKPSRVAFHDVAFSEATPPDDAPDRATLSIFGNDTMTRGRVDVG